MKLWSSIAILSFLLGGPSILLSQQNLVLGDLDGDGVATVRDIAIVAGHFSGTGSLSEAQKQLADVNKDGAVNDADMDELVKEILGTRNPETLPLSTVRFTSPSSGEADVAVTRETVVYFTVPLSLSAALDTTKFQAEFGGKKILSRVEISSDRKKATLFYLEPLPSNARIRGMLDTTGLTDLLNRPVDGDADGLGGGVHRFSFDTLSITPLSSTAIVGRVIASERGTGGVETPLAGVTITVDGAEETLRAVTDAQGNFTLSPCPAGTFFVKIDGRTSPRSSWPGGDYYPFVGKKWHAIAGRTDNLSGDLSDTARGTIYLPRVLSSSLKTTSTTQETKIQFPAAALAANPGLAGTELLIPANSLFADDGTRGGKVGIAPVAPDRLPSPLPPGLNLPLVITIQTDGGTNFDRPVPVCFPNTPDPVTGQPLPPGAKSALWSFDHDTGQWEIAGAMTVTEDGKFVKTDPGVGVRQPGWHGTQPGSPMPGGDGEDPPPPCPPKEQTDKLCSPYRIKSATPPPGPNGCGAAGGGFAPNDFLYGDVFRDACNSHDMGYGSYVTCDFFALHKRAVDNAFLANMTARVNSGLASGEFTPDEAERAQYAANLYYAAVSLFGGDAYYAAQEAASDWDCPKSRDSGNSPNKVITNTPSYFVVTDKEFERTLKRGMLTSTDLKGLNLNVPGSRLMEVKIYLPRENLIANKVIISSRSGGKTEFRSPSFVAVSEIDTDGDGIADEAETIVGTNSQEFDTDKDGIGDGQELKNGSNPVDGIVLTIGSIASSPTLGSANDVSASSNLAAIAMGSTGISVFNVFSGLNPTRILDVDTPGEAITVSSAGDYISVADGQAGLAIIDVGDPASIRLERQMAMGTTVNAVASDGVVAYAGTGSGEIVAVDLATGLILGRLATGGGTPEDMQIVGDTLYVLDAGALRIFTLNNGTLAAAGSLSVSMQRSNMNVRFRLFSGGKVAYCAHSRGYHIVNVANPASPQLVQNYQDNQFGWKQIVANGSGLGIAAASPNSTPDGPHNIDLYNVGADGRGTSFVTTIVTPGLARAVSLYNGFAYVADSEAGLQVINYLPFDSLRQPPTITLASNFNLAGGLSEEGKRMRLTATVTDDVQVRNVEFYVNGTLRSTDGNYPYEFAFLTPAISPGAGSFTVRAKATDTGGNSTWTEVFTLTLTPDATPPVIVSSAPTANRLVGSINEAWVKFNEPMAEATLASGLTVTAGGAAVPATATYRESSNTAFLSFSQPLSPGNHVLTVAASITDAAGNPLTAASTIPFRVFALTDNDTDGLADDWESLLGLDKTKTDSNNNGIRDGDEDFDNDGLINGLEILVGTDPTRPDTDGDGIPDGLEDSDLEGLTDGREIVLGTDRFKPDSDDDTWSDEAEVSAGSDPLNPRSRPYPFLIQTPPITALNIGNAGSGLLTTVTATPPVTALSFAAKADGSLGSFIRATPDVIAVSLNGGGGALATAGSIRATPDVTVLRFDVTPAGPGNSGGGYGNGTILATPPVNAVQTGADAAGAPGSIILATPPVKVQRDN